MTPTSTETTEEISSEVPFVPFQTPFAKRICALVGVKKLSELIGIQVSFYGNEGGAMSTVRDLEHIREKESLPEEIQLSLACGDIFQIDIILSADATYFSGAVRYFKDDEDEPDAFYEAFYYVTIGPDERLLCIPPGNLADVAETEPGTK